MQQDNEVSHGHLFSVNGVRCHLELGDEALSWRKVSRCMGRKSCKKSVTRRIPLGQIIGTRCWPQLKSQQKEQTCDSAKQPETELAKCNRLKIYYAKSYQDTGSGKLLKAKRLLIEPIEGQHSSSDQSIEDGRSLENLARRLDQWLSYQRQSRPRRLLIFVNPFGGKGRAVQLFKSRVRRLFEIAEVETKVVITKYANHARDTLEDPHFNVEYFDGIVCVGGDGMFSELMNGLLFRYNREGLLNAELRLRRTDDDEQPKIRATDDDDDDDSLGDQGIAASQEQTTDRLVKLRLALGGIGMAFVTPPLPVGVIGAGSTDANSFGILGTNDAITAALNIILGKQIKIDVCSLHSIKEDRLLRFVSTFVAYGYFGDVIRESEKLRWLGPSRYDVTGLNNLLKNRTYKGTVRILVSGKDGSPSDFGRCHASCSTCKLDDQDSATNRRALDQDLSFLEKEGAFIGVNAAVSACRCPQSRKGFSPNNHLANGCADLILVRPCSRFKFVQYLMRTGWTNKSAFELGHVEAYRCRQFEFLAPATVSSLNNKSHSGSLGSSSSSSSRDSQYGGSTDDNQEANRLSSWNVDGEILKEQSVRVKVNNQLLKVFGTGEPQVC